MCSLRVNEISRHNDRRPLDGVFLHETVHALRDAGHSLAVSPDARAELDGASTSRPPSRERRRRDIADRRCPTCVRSTGTPKRLRQQSPSITLLPEDFKPDAVVSASHRPPEHRSASSSASGTIGGAWKARCTGSRLLHSH